MYRVNFVIEGYADFLFNRMSDQEQADFRSGRSGKALTDADRSEAAESRAYADAKGLYLPAWTMKRVILEGAQSAGFKINKKLLRQRLAAIMFVQGLPRFITPTGEIVAKRDYMSEVMGKQPPRTGRAAVIRRPAMSAGWRIGAEIAVLDDAVPEKAIRESLEYAGLYVGVGAWRPEFGRFSVAEWR